MENSQTNQPSFFERNAIIIKGFIIGFLILLLLIPTFMVNNIIVEREGRKREAIAEVSSKWGNQQVIVGPVLKVPYYEVVETENLNAAGKKEIISNKVLKNAFFLPENLKINGDVVSEERKRGIYEIVVYSSKLACSGSFPTISLEKFGAKKENIDWANASILLSISDLRGIQEEVVLDWNGQKETFNPGASLTKDLNSGIQTPVKIEDAGAGTYTFSLNLSLKGSEFIKFIPVGKTTNVALKSKWTSPSFDGAFLPDNRVVNENGFTADWKVLHLNRNFPQQWTEDDSIDLQTTAFGVTLITPNDGYQKSDRSVKYAILIIALTFMAFFFVEILNQKKMHPFHYILVGLALCIFYTLLVSISEFLSFNKAYLIATAMTIGLVFLYARSIFQSIKLASMITGVMLLLYGFIFTIIQLEDTALLVGSIGLFLILAILMYISRRIDWYNIGLKKAE